ncbi:hypothetical protein Aduo_006445 [Ancylostoma duodenale]
MTSSCSHMPSAASEKKRLRSWYAVIADKCAFPRTDSYAVTAVRLECLFVRNSVTTEYNMQMQATMGATHCSECPPEKRMSRLALQMCCSRCSSFLCLTHMKKHLREHRHDFAMSIETGYVYCACCSDFVYNRVLEVMRLGAMNKYRTRLGLCKLVSWNPTDADIKAWDMMTRVGQPAQLRGLLNMGSTCYMNSVLQALVHTPVLRDYFLSDQHSCQRSPGTCLMCTMHQLMQDFHRGDSSDPVAPSDVLHIVWEQSQMSMGGQQDAHEFFLAVHDLLHRHYNDPFSAPFSSSPVTETDGCKCIVHQTFTGKLRSDIICNKCSSVSSSTQPFLDVSLIVPPSSPADQISIKTCLEMFCAREDLDRNCERCGCLRATRRMSFKVLPSVIVFHLKRFSPSATGKNSTVVWFELESDMSPFTSAFLDNPSLFDPRTSAGMISHKNHSYSLFAIVTHIGDSSGAGHYISYVRRNQNKWYRCDDHQIKEVHYGDVVMTEAYLLFYQLTQLRLK